jgi:hypothetical protein
MSAARVAWHVAMSLEGYIAGPEGTTGLPPGHARQRVTIRQETTK